MDTPAILNSLSSSSSCGDGSCSVQPSSTPPRDDIVDSTRLTWQTLTTPTAEPTTTATHNEATPTTLPSCNEATPTTSLPPALKKVTFSTPEVTANHHFDVPDVVGSDGTERIKIRKLKKRHRHHSGNQGEEEAAERREEGRSSGAKRRKTKEGSERDMPRQSSNAGLFRYPLTSMYVSMLMNLEVSLSVSVSVPEFAVQTSSVRFSDVGGCDEAIKEISKLLLHLLHPEVFSWLGVSPPQGFLLHGPPGCGKTLLAYGSEDRCYLALPRRHWLNCRR